uniref:BEACH-type PH domain-containing protein n=1 Tax=Romanomermis culicivorax TaxID=13658 RepID=A0A915IKJ0_ROMCU
MQVSNGEKRDNLDSMMNKTTDLPPISQNSDTNSTVMEIKDRQVGLTNKLKKALDSTAPFLRDIFTDFRSYLQKQLLGTHGQEIMNDQKGENLCEQTAHSRLDEENTCDMLITAARRRDNLSAYRIQDKILNILTSKHGAWSGENRDKKDYRKLDVWEDDSRRRRRLVPNPIGSNHPEATLKAAVERESINFTSSAKLVAPGLVLPGILSISSTDMSFDCIEDDPEFKVHDAKVYIKIPDQVLV